jgi:3-hydroxyacyl-[acyl-carrier-protein] dehydratase
MVASNPFLDLSTIDLNAVAVDRATVGTINPHTGDMRHLDHVIWLNEDQSMAVGVKHVRDDEFWVPGHIPGRPLLPGVIMIEAAAQLSSVLYKLRSQEEQFLGFTRCEDTTFRGQVVPGDTLYLISREVTFRARRFISQNQGIVNGSIVFESKITGMVL